MWLWVECSAGSGWRPAPGAADISVACTQITCEIMPKSELKLESFQVGVGLVSFAIISPSARSECNKHGYSTISYPVQHITMGRNYEKLIQK